MTYYFILRVVSIQQLAATFLNPDNFVVRYTNVDDNPPCSSLHALSTLITFHSFFMGS